MKSVPEEKRIHSFILDFQTQQGGFLLKKKKDSLIDQVTYYGVIQKKQLTSLLESLQFSKLNPVSKFLQQDKNSIKNSDEE